MSNPTRKEIKKVRKVLGRSTFADICDLALRAWDMRDALEKNIQDDGRDEGITDEGYPYWIAGRIEEEIKKFDGGGDEQKHDPAGEWGGGHTR